MVKSERLITQLIVLVVDMAGMRLNVTLLIVAPKMESAAMMIYIAVKVAKENMVTVKGLHLPLLLNHGSAQIMVIVDLEMMVLIINAIMLVVQKQVFAALLMRIVMETMVAIQNLVIVSILMSLLMVNVEDSGLKSKIVNLEIVVHDMAIVVIVLNTVVMVAKQLLEYLATLKDKPQEVQFQKSQMITLVEFRVFI
jgi:hypothetical protein